MGLWGKRAGLISAQGGEGGLRCGEGACGCVGAE